MSLCSNPLSNINDLRSIVPGTTVSQALIHANLSILLKHLNMVCIVVERNNTIIPIDESNIYSIVLLPGDILGIRIIPGKGGGKNPLGMILSVAVMAAAWWAGAYFAADMAAFASNAYAAGMMSSDVAFFVGSYGAQIVSGAVMLAGNMASSLLVTPSRTSAPSIQSGSGGTTEEHYAITGSGNKMNKYGVIPYPIGGSIRIYPTHAADPYTEIVGDDEFMRQIFMVYGPTKIEDIRIGDTPLENFTDYEIQTREGWDDDTPTTLYSSGEDISQTFLSISLKHESGFVSRRTSTEADEINFDISLRLFSINQSNGNRTKSSVEIQCEYRKVGDSTWSNWTTGTTNIIIDELIEVSSKRNFRIVVPTRGQYDIRWKRITEDDTTGFVMNETNISALRTVTLRDPIVRSKLPPMTEIAIRIKGTGQLSGVINELSFLGTKYLPVYDGASWSYQLTDNPAWAYVNVLRSPAMGEPIPVERLDLTRFVEWADFCTTKGLKIGSIQDAPTTVFALLKSIAAVGLAAPSMRDNLYSVAIDNAKPQIAQIITPRNSWNFQSNKTFADVTHALRVNFKNKDMDFQQDEMIVYYPGYSADNADKYETLDLEHVTDPATAWMLGRFHISQLILRPEEFKIWMDIEHVRCNRGDRVKLVHDSILIGLGQARIIKTYIVDPEVSDDVIAIDIDAEWVIDPTKSYTVGIRLSDGSIVNADIKYTSGQTRYIEFKAAIPEAYAPVGGELIYYGESGKEAEDCIVMNIESGSKFTGFLTLRHYAPALQTINEGDIPEFESNITLPTARRAKQPGIPNIDTVVSDESVLTVETDGTISSRICVKYTPASGEADTYQFQIRHRFQGQSWKISPYLQRDSRLHYIQDVVDGMEYSIQIRAISTYGTVSDWSPTILHTVVGKSSPPTDVSSIVKTGNRLSWECDAPIDLDGYEIRVNQGNNPYWNNATKLYKTLIRGNFVDLDNIYANDITFLIKAVDTSGNYSENATTLFVDFGTAVIENNIHEESYEPTWPGTITGGSIVDDEIVANSLAFMWTGDTNLMWNSNPDNLLWTGQYEKLEYLFSYDVDTLYVGDSIVLSYILTGENAILEYSLDKANWYTFTGRINDIIEATYYFRISCEAGYIQGIINSLSVIIDAKTKSESFSYTGISDLGTRLTLSKSYRTIKTVVVSVDDDGGSAAYAIVADKSTTGPLIKTYSSSGTQVAGHVSGYIEGY